MMTKKSRCFLKGLSLLSVLCTAVFTASAQINLTATGGTTAASYSTLGAAFTAINNGTHTGLITINVAGNTTETATATLNASGSGSASYTSIFVQPSGGTARTISGNIAGSLISLSGADFVSFDGLNTGGNSLTISNTNTGNTASTIRFASDASNNTITNCMITGASVGTGTATIVFGGAVSTGNDNNTISNNTIAEAGTTPTNAILINGNVGMENTGNIISGNNIANYFAGNTNSIGISATSGTIGLTIQNNKFYQTATRNATIVSSNIAISILTGTGHTIAGNTIGYASAAGTGNYTLTGAVFFIGIQLSLGTGGTATSVQSNTITAFNITTAASTSTGAGMFSGIYVTGSGDVNIGTTSGNTIGAASGTGAITVTTSGTNGTVMGISIGTLGTVVIQNNTIGGISSIGSTAAVGTGLNGIYTGGAFVPASINIADNTIGNATANNMVAGTSGVTTAPTAVSGMNFTITAPTTTITGNTIQNLASYGTTTSTSCYARGIWTAAATGSSAIYKVKNNTVKNITGFSALTSVTSGQAGVLGINVAIGTADTISGNTIFNIQANNTDVGSYNASGITLANATNTVVCNNIIYGISNEGTGTTASAPPSIAGITIRSGTTGLTIYNNMISLGNGITTNTAIIGIWGNYGSTPNPTTNIYHNTINIQGTASSGSLPSFCFHRGDFSLNRLITVDIRNNIFTNSRSGGTGKHYAIGNNMGFTASNAGWGTNASNYNVLNAADPAAIGYWTSDVTFADWQTASASDASSFSDITVTYVNSTSNLHLNMGTNPTLLESGCIPIATSSADIDGQSRPGPAGSVNGGATGADFGADEFDGVPASATWVGATDDNWNTASNWNTNSVPYPVMRVVFMSGLSHYPIITTGTISIRNVQINSGATVTVSGGTFRISGNIVNNGTFNVNGTGTLELNGSTAQTIPASAFSGNTVSNLTLNNNAGATLNGTVGVTGVYTPTSGVLTTNGYLVLKSTASGTGRIAAGSTSGGYISGNVTVERFIPGRRAYRFLAHPFSSSIALTQLTDDIDITGNGGASNGFTPTATNRPSSFRFDVATGDNSTTGANPGWAPFTNTDGLGANAWASYTGALIMVRGAIGEGLNGAAYTPSDVTLDMTGAVNQGNTTVNLTKGANTDYVFVGNPFPSSVNMDAISGSNTGSAFYIWDATQGTKGGYTSYSFGSSSFNLPSCGGFITTLSANGSLTFEEADKTASSSTMFKTTAAANTVQLRIEDSTTFWDRLLVRFDDNADAAVDYPDAAKLTNSEINFFSFSKEDSMLSIDARPYADGQAIQLGLNATLKKNFKIVASEFDMPAGTNLFLHDKYLNKVEQITGAGYEYWFAVNADAASSGTARFELLTKGQPTPTNVSLATSAVNASMTLMPNPAKDNVAIRYEGMSNGSLIVTVKDIKGATVAEQQQASAGNGSIQLSLKGLAAGVYMVTLQNGNQAIVQKLVKE